MLLNILELLTFIVLSFIIKFYYDYFTRSIPYPGPLPLPIVGNLHHYFYYSNDIPSWLHRLSLKYGNVFELYFGSDKYLMISDSRVVERVMSPVKDNNYFVRVTDKKGLDELQKGHNGMLFNMDFDSWFDIRKIFIRATVSPNALRFAVKLVNNVFHDLEGFFNNLIEEQGQISYDDQEKSVEIDFATWAKRIFAEITMLMVVNRQANVLSTYYNKIVNKNPDDDNNNDTQKNLNEEFLDRLFIASDCMQYYVMVPPLVRNLPIINNYTNYLYENLMWTRNYAINLVKERREEIESIDDKEKLASDMLTMLLTANTSFSNDNNDKEPLSHEEIGDNIAEILIEGIDSPSNALSSIIYCVGNNPDVEQRILDEIEKVFGHGSDFNITYEDLSKLEYIEAVIKEVLRIRPVTATISRIAANSDQIDEYKIPQSSKLAINIMGLHKNSNYWEEPTKFNPSRFLVNNEKETYDKNAFLYFGGGLRLCPGRQFAMIELKMVIVLLYNKYKFEMIAKEPLMQYNVNSQCKELKIRIKQKII